MMQTQIRTMDKQFRARLARASFETFVCHPEKRNLFTDVRVTASFWDLLVSKLTLSSRQRWLPCIYRCDIAFEDLQSTNYISATSDMQQYTITSHVEQQVENPAHVPVIAAVLNILHNTVNECYCYECYTVNKCYEYEC